jgi:hypothetical protein
LRDRLGRHLVGVRARARGRGRGRGRGSGRGRGRARVRGWGGEQTMKKFSGMVLAWHLVRGRGRSRCR